MSLGLSAIHLASAVRDNGAGRVVTTELSAAKVTAATATFAEVGLEDVITVLAGDALQTLADLDAPVDFVLLDGWKELYLPVLRLLEPKLSRAPSWWPTTPACRTPNRTSTTCATRRTAM